ncbi:MAG: nucleotide sugar dehydrogenase [bacterium]|nr:nucleotide sugar dehydrogenase [bacterium]
MSPRDTAERTLIREIESRSVACGVIGLGFIGSTLVDALMQSGFSVRGYDRDPAAVARASDRATVDTDASVIGDARVVFVAVRAIVGDGGEIDLEPLNSAAQTLRAHGVDGKLILVESTLPPGTTRRFAAESLGIGEASTTFVAHSPERLSAGHDWRVFRDTPHLVGGIDPASARVAERMLASVCKQVVPVSSPEVSELSKLLENVFISTGVALAGEITRLAHELGLSGAEVCEAAATKPFGYRAFHPGPGVGGHCLPNDLRILRTFAHDAGFVPPVLDGVERTTAAMPGYVVDRLDSALRDAGVRLEGSTVLLVGVGFKIGHPDTTKTPARAVARVLRARGAEVCFLDSQVNSFEVDGEPVRRMQNGDLRSGAIAAAILLAGDAQVEPARLREASAVVLDAGGGDFSGVGGDDRLLL